MRMFSRREKIIAESKIFFLVIKSGIIEIIKIITVIKIFILISRLELELKNIHFPTTSAEFKFRKNCFN